MPDGTNTIYIDSTFLAPSDGAEDTSAEVFFTEADVIGAYNIPVELETTTSVAGTTSIVLKYFQETSSTSGINYIYIDFFSTGSGIPFVGDETCVIDYSSPTILISGTKNVYIDCYTAGQGLGGDPVTTSGYKPLHVDYIVGQVFTDYLDVDIPVNYWAYPSFSGTENLPVNFSYFAPFAAAINKITEASFGSLTTVTSGIQYADVEVTFAGMVNYPLNSDVFCTISGIDSVESELTVISGSVYNYYFEAVCGVTTSGVLPFELYCGLVDYDTFDYELTVISGAVEKIDVDLWCGDLNTEGVNFDVELFPLKISNFQPAEDNYHFSSDGISVDITDDVFNVLTSSGTACSGTCCLQVDGAAVEVTYSGITDGYRMYYNPSEGFSSLVGSTEFLVHAENSNGDILERSYYLTSGYLVDYENYYDFDYGYNNEVIVRMSAENFATCPRFSADAYWFTTEQLKYRDLTASITAQPELPFHGSGDLSASISPQSTAFEYGKTFRIVLTCSDFAGNEMEPYEFEFKIEN